jgi:CRISPR-associated endonuclease/helicase Cas3
MKLYNSFKTLIEAVEPISSILLNHDNYKAHTHSVKDAETLIEHIEKVNTYALKLIDVHGLDEVADRIIDSLLAKQTEITHHALVGDYIKSLFIQAIIFHDYGKINPNFQVEKMNNQLFVIDKSIKIDSQHSRLSAYLYLTAHFKNITEHTVFSDNEKILLLPLTILFANPILKHHSGYLEHQVIFEEPILQSLKQFLSKLQMDFDVEAYFSKEYQEHFFNNFHQIFKHDKENPKEFFMLYALLKLNFSLLTAADYYATTAFMNDLEVDDFGLMNEDFKRKIVNGFQHTKLYNKLLFEQFAYFKSIPFDSLQSQSSENLNLLRQKLMVEVIEGVRTNTNANLFYIEAPTGGGKTNLSLGAAIELLKANHKLNKVFYVFPFNTLITQTFQAITSTLGITNNDIIQLHSKSGFHSTSEEQKDGRYGDEKLNYIDNLFINYPITLFSHIKFFDILKGNGKESNYILHRLSNSIVIIDELQSYNPKHWDKVIFLLSNYASLFNIKIILMSATLPKLDKLDERVKDKITALVPNKDEYFLNPNFKDRVSFDFTLLKKWKKPRNDEEKEEYLWNLKDFLFTMSHEYSLINKDKVSTIIEFISKKTASKFYKIISEDKRFTDYQLFLVSGEILEPRRKQIIQHIKAGTNNKVLLIATQVVEAGVDIDMDLGFKDKSLIDSDEQLAGRVNRNASKRECKVYIFDLDKEGIIYGKDERYKITSEQITDEQYRTILEQKNFDILYNLVNDKINKGNKNPYLINLSSYTAYFKSFKLQEISKGFQLIEEANNSVFVPLAIPVECFLPEEITFLNTISNTNCKDKISGEHVFESYIKIVTNKQGDFFKQSIQLKKIYGILSKYMFSVFKTQEQVLEEYIDKDIKDRFGILYLSHWEKIYTYAGGIDLEKIKSDVFL